MQITMFQYRFGLEILRSIRDTHAHAIRIADVNLAEDNDDT